MKTNNKTITLTIGLVLSFQVFSGTNSLMTTSQAKAHINCSTLDKKRNVTSESYNKYANCVVNNKYDTFYTIYKRHLRKNPKDIGSVKIKASVNEFGKITKAEILETGIKSKRVLRIIKARLKLIKLSAPNNKNASFNYLFEFDDSEA